MKKTIIWLAMTFVLVGLIWGATVIYNNYMEENGVSGIAGVGGLFEEGEKPENSTFGEAQSSETVMETESESDMDTENEPQSEAKPETDGEAVTETEAESESKPENETETETETDGEAEAYYPAPDFTVYTADGEAVKLSDFMGKPIVINFWARDCGYCVSEMPAFQQAYEKYGDEVVFMMVCHLGFAKSTIAREQAFIDSKGYTFPVYYDVDGDAVNEYWIRGIPNTYFVESDGGLYQYYIPGATDYATLEECIVGAMEK